MEEVLIEREVWEEISPEMIVYCADLISYPPPLPWERDIDVSALPRDEVN